MSLGVCLDVLIPNIRTRCMLLVFVKIHCYGLTVDYKRHTLLTL
jgi:hypothetical protein